MSDKALGNAEEIDYSFPKLGKKRWALILTSFFLIGFIGAFPFFLTIENKIKSALSSIPGCSISFKEINFHFFLPKVVVSDVAIPASCYSNKNIAPLELKEIRLNFKGISFAPFGPHFKLETVVLENPINAYLTFGIFSHAINIKDNKFDLSKISPLLPELKLKGEVLLNALLNFSNSNIQELKIAASSKNLMIPGQKIFGFTLPMLNIGDFLLKGQMDQKSVLKVENFILGDTESPIRSNFNGTINLNTRNISSSRLNLNGEVSFSEKFMTDIPLIEMAMQRFTKKDQFYQIAITGQMASPTVKSPDK